MQKTIDPKARELIARSISDYGRYLNDQFTSTEDAKRNLQPGLVGKNILKYAKRRNVIETEIWKALFDSFVYQPIRWPEPQSPHTYNFDWQTPCAYVLERHDFQGEFKVELSLRLWEDLIKNFGKPEIRKEIQRVCDWFESQAALSAYCIYKLNKNCFQEDAFKAWINRLIQKIELRVPFVTPTERDVLFRGGLDDLKYGFGKEGVTDWEAAKFHDPKPSKWEHDRLDKWLFQIWPLVKHYDWTMKEISAVIQEKSEKKIRTNLEVDFEKYPCKSPDTLGQHCRLVLGLRHEDRPLGKPSSREHAFLPPRAFLALHF
jgi:hypothetical protein